ncbi:hypothetical protein ABKA04_001354 [Annulohypoxylon sp. FPYF3050]
MEPILYEIIRKRIPGTGMWILEHPKFVEWTETAKSTLLLNGIRMYSFKDAKAPMNFKDAANTTYLSLAASGKTFLCASVIEHLQRNIKAENPQIGLAYYFFDYADPNTTTADGLLSSLLVQLWDQVGERRPVPLPLPHNPRPSFLQSDILSMLRDVASCFKKVFIVVDALDEAGVHRLQNMLNCIDELRQIEANFHLFISSRYVKDVEHALMGSSLLMVSIEPSCVEHEMRTYVLWSIEHNRNLRQLPRELQEQLLEFSTASSQGVFLVPVLIFQKLSEVENPDEIQDFLASFTGISEIPYDIYRRVLMRIDNCKRGIAHDLLRWMVYSLEPLSLSELAEAAILKPGRSSLYDEGNRFNDPRDILKIIGPLVRISYRSENITAQKIQFIYDAIPDFLKSEEIKDELCVVSAFAVGKGTEMFIAEACLEYIMLYFRSNERRNHVADFVKFPLLEYACKHWTNHVRRCENDRDDNKSQANPDGGNITRIESLVFLFLSDPETLSCWLSIFDPEEPSKLPFTAQHSETPALCYAVYSGSLGVFRSLLAAGADAAASNKYGRQPLHLAVELHQVSIVNELLGLPNAIAHALARDASGNVPIALAALSDNISLVNIFFRLTEIYQVNQIKATMIDGIPFLFYLARYVKGNIFEAFLRFLCIDQSGINIKDGTGRTLLHHAVEENNQSAISMLLHKGINMNSRDAEKDTPLHLAIRKDLDTVSALLINSGADVFLRNLVGIAPLEEAWVKKSLDWSSYEVDQEKTDGISLGNQAQCRVLHRKQKSTCGEPDEIFRKMYHLSDVEDASMREVCVAIMRENRALQQFAHPFIISYLGFTQTRKDQKLQEISIYLEYCDQGDLETRHVEKSQAQLHADAEDEDLLANLKLGETPMKPREVMFLVVLKSGPNNTRIAKLCDLGTVTIKNKTNARWRGTEEYWPPEIRNNSRNWSTKGDVYGLSKTIQDIAKNFTPGAEMQRIFDGTQHELPEKRWNCLDALEEIHKHRSQLKEPFVSFDSLLGNGPGGYIYQAFLKISEELDTWVPYSQEHTKKQREKQLKRLELILGDGAAEAFRTHSSSLHLAVLFGDEARLKELLDQGQDPNDQWPSYQKVCPTSPLLTHNELPTNPPQNLLLPPEPPSNAPLPQQRIPLLHPHPDLLHAPPHPQHRRHDPGRGPEERGDLAPVAGGRGDAAAVRPAAGDDGADEPAEAQEDARVFEPPAHAQREEDFAAEEE